MPDHDSPTLGDADPAATLELRRIITDLLSLPQLPQESVKRIERIQARHELNLRAVRDQLAEEVTFAEEPVAHLLNLEAQRRIVDLIADMVEQIFEAIALDFMAVATALEYERYLDLMIMMYVKHAGRRWSVLTQSFLLQPYDKEDYRSLEALAHLQEEVVDEATVARLVAENAAQGRLRKKAEVLKTEAWRRQSQCGDSSVGMTGAVDLRSDNNVRCGALATAQSTKVDRPSVVLGTAGLPSGRPPAVPFASNPEIRKLVEEHPEFSPVANQLVQVDRARAQAEVAFRERELAERWGTWSGVHPWVDKPDLETTDCPWWIAGAEYVFRVAFAWRTYSYSKPEHTEAILPKQVELTATWVYWNRVFVHDCVHAPNSKVENFFSGRNVKRFANFAFLFCLRKFAAADLDEWRRRATELTEGDSDLAGPVAADDATATVPAADQSALPGISTTTEAYQDRGALAQEPSDSRANSDVPKQEGSKQRTGKARKGDATLLGEKRLVSFGTAEQYLGISERQRQKLINSGALNTEGRGHNRKVTVESLKCCLPLENPN
jgi:hypothetical protein